MNLKGKTVLFLGTGCHIGYIPFAPGTFGSLEGLFICFLMAKFSIWLMLPITIAVILVSIWIADAIEKDIGKKDPGIVVIDEIAGMMVTMLGISMTLTHAAAGFIVFRCLDIIKPPPIRWLDRQLPGGAGIVLDDVAAGIVGNLILRLMINLTGL